MDFSLPAGEERLSHAYIVASASPEESMRTARLIAAAAVCSGSGTRPCGECRHCRKVSQNIHPDVTLVERLPDDKGKLSAIIKVDQIREMKLDASILPNEAERKVYIVREAERLNPQGQNAALKLLEEPPKHVVLILCTDNAQTLLPTVRSRCTEIFCGGGESSFSGSIRERTDEYLRAAASGDRFAIVTACIHLEGLSNAEMTDFCDCTSLRVTQLLCGRETLSGLSRESMMTIYRLLQKCREYLVYNVGVKHLAGLLSVDTPAEK